MSWLWRCTLALVLLVGTGCAVVRADRAPDPRDGAVPLPAQGGWRAHLVLDQGDVGIWTVKAFPLLASVGSDEIVALDDRGRCLILIPYSGRWTPLECVHDGAWLGGLAHGDLDPRVPGPELYTGGKRGNLWQVVPHAHGALETRLVAHLPGREIHTLVVGDVDAEHDGLEMVVFTWPGGLYLVRSTESGLELVELQELKSRIRDAVLLPADAHRSAEIATVSRSGRLALLTLARGEPRWEEVYRVRTGMGRIALRPAAEGGELVLYVVCDDGRVYRFERVTRRAWKEELIYAGALGGRGVVAGRFDADPQTETLAIFGYGRQVELLARGKEGWVVTTIFTDRDKGHWLAAAEVDGRNDTAEIFCCGYGGRLVMLYRPPGYGRPGVATPK
ncbi:MAG: hypothetical protein ACYTEZ_15925 [Planctomycetota bacterium]|jgi:hypothetical protein